MTAPPGIAPIGVAAGHVQAGEGTDLSSKRSKIAYVRDNLGVTAAEANRLIRAYEADCAQVLRDYDRMHFRDWLSKLMSEAPLGLKRARKVQQRGWRVATS